MSRQTMFRFSLRTLIIGMLLGGPLCAWAWNHHISAWWKQCSTESEIEVETEIEVISESFIVCSLDVGPSGQAVTPADDCRIPSTVFPEIELPIIELP